MLWVISPFSRMSKKIIKIRLNNVFYVMEYVITDKISMPNVLHLFDGKTHKSFLAVSQRNIF